MHIFTNISRSKGNQAMKFGQLIAYNIRNIFLEKSYTKCGRETISRNHTQSVVEKLFLDPFLKNQN